MRKRMIAAFAALPLLLGACAYSVSSTPEQPTSTYSTAKSAVYDLHETVPSFVLDCNATYNAEAYAETTDTGDRWKEHRKTNLGPCRTKTIQYKDGRVSGYWQQPLKKAK